MVVKRVITGISIGIFAGIIIWVGEPWFTIVFCLTSVLATFEYYRIVRNEHIKPLTYLGIAFSILFILNAYIQQYRFTSPLFSSYFVYPLLFALLTLIPLIWMLFRHNKDNSFINWSWTVTGVLYVSWLLSFYILIRALDNGIWWTLLVLSSTAMCDVFAFFIGSTLGKHSLASSISPGKTWEGAVGGLTASIAFSVILSIWFDLPLNYWQMIVAGLIIGVFSQLGDLVESLLKRNMKAKDAGNLLPGHGGILDRIDSHLFIAPVAYYLIVLAIEQGWLSR